MGLAIMRAWVQIQVTESRCCEYELLTFIIAPTTPTSLRLGGLLNRMAKCLSSLEFFEPCPTESTQLTAFTLVVDKCHSFSGREFRWPAVRPAGQLWLFFLREAVERSSHSEQLSFTHSEFNYSATYRLDSTIPTTVGDKLG